MIARRSMLAAPLLVLTPLKGAAASNRRRVTQGELDYAINEHVRWLDGGKSGRRANFSSCDLSGLYFGFNNPNQVMLRGADFTEANLNGIVGNDINFHHTSFQYADLSFSRLKAPVFACADLGKADCRDVIWGWPTSDRKLHTRRTCPSEQALFMSARLAGASFDRARVRGYFNDSSMAGASLALADFSYSEFTGNESFNRFGNAKLLGTKFHFATISSARFNNAVIKKADFLGSKLHPRIAAHLLTRDAKNVAA